MSSSQWGGATLLLFLVISAIVPVRCQVPISDSVCEENGCYRPSTCSDAFAAYQRQSTNASSLTIFLRGEVSQPGYIAFGLSKSGNMHIGGNLQRDASVIACLIDGSGTITGGHYYNAASGRASTRVTPTQGLTLTASRRDGGSLHCVFQRDVTITTDPDQVFSLNAAYTLLYARGDTSGDALRGHTCREASSEEVNIVTTSGQATGSTDNSLKKAHGCLMITAWVLFAGFGIILARFYKDNFGETKLCSKKLWFALHRACMTMALASTAAAFIIIFVDVGGYVEFGPDAEGHMKAHPPLGIIVMVLVITNPVMALFRPHPDGKHRPIFNWAHWAVGLTAYILSVVTIFFGMDLTATALFAPISLRYVMAGYSAFHGLSYLILEVARCISLQEEKKADNMEMQQSGESEAAKPSPVAVACGATFRAAYLGIYCTVVFGLWLAMILIIAID